MNVLVDAWDQVEERKDRLRQRDSIVIDGEERLFEEKKEMAGVEYRLGRDRYRKYLRLAKSMKLEDVISLRTITWETLKRLRVPRDLKKAVKGVPKGSDQVNVSDVVTWLRSIPAEGQRKYDRRTVRQLVALDATLHWRVVG